MFMLERDAYLKLKARHRTTDLLDVLKADDYSRLSGRLLDLGSKMTALKAGRRGIYFRTREQSAFRGLGAARPGNPADWSSRELWCPALLCRNVASATGSGDSAVAGFLHAYLKGFDPEQCLKAANCLGWQNVQVLDAISGIKDWKETQAIMRRNLPFEELSLKKAPGWQWDRKRGLWRGPHDTRE
jgi:sugar/nucleoside kinase (ribokinase family)